MFCSNGNSGSWIIILILILLFAGGNTGYGICGNANRCGCGATYDNGNCTCNNTCC